MCVCVYVCVGVSVWVAAACYVRVSELPALQSLFHNLNRCFLVVGILWKYPCCGNYLGISLLWASSGNILVVGILWKALSVTQHNKAETAHPRYPSHIPPSYPYIHTHTHARTEVWAHLGYLRERQLGAQGGRGLHELRTVRAVTQL